MEEEAKARLEQEEQKRLAEEEKARKLAEEEARKKQEEQEKQEMLDNLNSEIDNMKNSDGTPMSLEQKAILKQIVGMDFVASKAPTVKELTQIIQDAAKNAETDLTPYYEKITGRTLEDLKNQMSDIRDQSARYAQQEEKGYKKLLANTKQSLRASGRTFGGKARGVLGSEAAIKQEGAVGSDKWVEGEIPQDRRYTWDAQRASWEGSARNLGIEAERKLGSANVPGFAGVIDPYKSGYTFRAGQLSPLYKTRTSSQEGYVKTGDYELDKLKEIEKSKWDRVAKYRPYI